MVSIVASIQRSQRKARVLDDIKAFRQRLVPAPASASAADWPRNPNNFGGGPSLCEASSAKYRGHFPNRPFGRKETGRPNTTDGVSPRPQVFFVRGRTGLGL